MYVENSISVIISAHEYSDVFYKCLKAYEGLQKKPLEIIVVLDKISKKNDFFEQFSLPFCISENEPPYGPATARNIGSLLANGEILFFSDSDVEILDNTLHHIVDKFNKNKKLHALIGSYDDTPYDKSIVSKFRNLLHHYVHQTSDINASTFWTACGAIKKNVFEKIGGFDVSFKKPSVEDIEFGYRLNQANYTICLEKEIQVKHMKKWTLFSMLKTDIFYRAKPWTKLLLKHKHLKKSNLNVNKKNKLSIILLLGMFFTEILALSMSKSFFIATFITFNLIIIINLNVFKFYIKYFNLYEMPLIILLYFSYLLSASIGFGLGFTEFIVNRIKK